MTIETKIAKNGSKRYYVRENGKNKAISRDTVIAAIRKTSIVEGTAEIATERGDQYVVGFNSEKSCYAFTDQNGNVYESVWADEILRNIVNGELEQNLKIKAADEKVNAEIDDSVIEAAARNVIETKDATEFEAFLAAANGLSVAELRQKQFDTEIRIAERACKSVISDLENEIDYLKYDNERTNGNLNDFALNFGVDCEEDSDYIKEMVNQIHANDDKIAEAQKQIDTIKAALSADEYATKEVKAESLNVENVDEINAEIVISEDAFNAAVDAEIENANNVSTETNAEVKTEADDAEFKRKIKIVGISRRLAELKDENAELCEEIHDARDLGEDKRHKALAAELHKNNLTIIALSKALRELEAENTNNDDEPETPETPETPEPPIVGTEVTVSLDKQIGCRSFKVGDEYVNVKTDCGHWIISNFDLKVCVSKSSFGGTRFFVKRERVTEEEFFNYLAERGVVTFDDTPNVAESLNVENAEVVTTDFGRTIEHAKVTVEQAAKIINRLAFTPTEFKFTNVTFSNDRKIEYRHFDGLDSEGEVNNFAIAEIVINGKLEIVRFYNFYREITVDLQIGNLNYRYEPTYGGIEIIETPETPETPETSNKPDKPVKIARFEQGKTYFEIDWSTHGAGKHSVTIERRTAKSVYILGDRYAIREEDGSEYIKFTYDYITTNKFYAKFADKPETPDEGEKKFIANVCRESENGNRVVKSKTFNTAAAAADWIINYTNEHHGYRVVEGTEIREVGTPIAYKLTERDIDIANGTIDAGKEITNQLTELPADPNENNFAAARYVTSVVFTQCGQKKSLPQSIVSIRSTDFARAEKAKAIMESVLNTDTVDVVETPHISLYPTDNKLDKVATVYYAAELDGTEDDDDENVFDYLPDVAELRDVDEQSDCEVAAELSKVLGRGTFKFNPEFVDVTLPNGKKIVTTFRSLEITPDWERDFGFVFTDGDNDFAAYNSVGAVARVIEMIDEAVKRGATEFTFPPAESVITFKPSTPNTHDDEFSKKLAELKASVDKNEAKFHVAEQTVRDARIAADEANKVWLDSYDAFAKYGFGRANELHERLIDMPKLHSAIYNAGIAVYGTDGLKKNPFRIKIIFRPEGMNFAIADDGITIAAYSTPDNVERAMKMFADAVNHGDSKFTFPTEDDLNSLGEMHRRIDFADYSTHAAPRNKYRLHIAERRKHAAKI